MADIKVPSNDGLGQARGTFEPPAPGNNRAFVTQRETRRKKERIYLISSLWKIHTSRNSTSIEPHSGEQRQWSAHESDVAVLYVKEALSKPAKLKAKLAGERCHGSVMDSTGDKISPVHGNQSLKTLIRLCKRLDSLDHGPPRTRFPNAQRLRTLGPVHDFVVFFQKDRGGEALATCCRPGIFHGELE